MSSYREMNIKNEKKDWEHRERRKEYEVLNVTIQQHAVDFFVISKNCSIPI